MAKTVTENRRKRYLYFWARVTWFPLIPVAILSVQYDLLYFQEYSGTKWTLSAFLVIGSLVFIFWRHLNKWIDSWLPSLGKSFIDISIRLLPAIILTGLLEGFRRNISHLVQTWWMILGAYIISVLFKQGHDYFRVADVETSKNRKYK